MPCTVIRSSPRRGTTRPRGPSSTRVFAADRNSEEHRNEELRPRHPRRHPGFAVEAGGRRSRQSVRTAIADALANGETVTLANFGMFPPKTRPARQGRNSRTGESMACERQYSHPPRVRHAFDDDKAGPAKTKSPHLGGARHPRQPVPNFSVGRPLCDAVSEPASRHPDVHPHRKGHGRHHDRLSGRLAYLVLARKWISV